MIKTTNWLTKGVSKKKLDKEQRATKRFLRKLEKRHRKAMIRMAKKQSQYLIVIPELVERLICIREGLVRLCSNGNKYLDTHGIEYLFEKIIYEIETWNRMDTWNLHMGIDFDSICKEEKNEM